MNRKILATAILIAASAFFDEACAEMLITEQEGALPPAAASNMTFRGVTRGPKVQVISPAAEGAVVKSPIDLRLKFESFGGATIDPASVKVTYLKSPAVDLTSRLKNGIKAGGIEMPSADLPVGDHPIRVEIKDSEGRAGSANLILKVVK